MSRVTNSAKLLAEAYLKQGKLIEAWPTEHGPRSLAEGYKIASEVDKILDKPIAGYKVVENYKTKVSYLFLIT